MGSGDDVAPALRADPYPATLQSAGGFRLLFLTFTAWDVIKFAAQHGTTVERFEIEATRYSTDAVYAPALPGVLYCFTAQGCAKAADGSTGYCSPVSEPVCVRAAVNTSGLRAFLQLSGVSTDSPVALRPLLAHAQRGWSLRAVMNPGG